MSAYVDYTYYTDTYLGGLTPQIDSASSFSFLERKAENYLNYRTHGDYLNVEDEEGQEKIKNCLCALVDSFNEEETTTVNGAIKQSESVGGHSVSYAVTGATQYSVRRDVILQEWLWDLGILRSRKVYGLHEG